MFLSRFLEVVGKAEDKNLKLMWSAFLVAPSLGNVIGHKKVFMCL